MRKAYLASALSFLAGSGSYSILAEANDEGVRQGIDEIIVTAQRRQASLQDTDIAISAFTETAIKDMGITSYGDMGDFVPNMMTHETVGTAGTAVNIRGMKNAETLITYEPKVAVYLDGVLLGKNTGSAFDILDLERVEVLRGPQGTLYGRNTVGGAINLITKKPTDDISGSLSLTLGSYDQKDIKGTVNVPLIGKNGVFAAGGNSTLNLRATWASMERDGYWTNSGPSGDRKLGDRNRDAAYVQLLWSPSTRFSLLYAFDMTDANETGTPRPATFVRDSFIPAVPYLQEMAKNLADDNDFKANFDFPHVQNLDVKGHSLTADFDLNDRLTLVSITGYREAQNEMWSDSDGTPLSIRGNTQTSEHEMITEELRLVGSGFGDDLKYVVGLFYMHENGDVLHGSMLPTTTDITTADFKNDVGAIFVEGTYNVTDRLSLTLGARYTEEHRSMSKQVYAFAGGPWRHPKETDLPIMDFQGDRTTWRDVSGTVSLSYQWTDDLMTYAKVAKAFASGGFNARAPNETAFNRPFDEETLISYELGLKSTWFDNRVLVNASVFHNDYQDLQVNQFDPVSAANNLSNAGDATIDGFELEVQAQVTDRFQIGGSYGYLDPTYETYVAADGTDLSLSYWSHSPDHNAHLYARYVISDTFLGGDFSARLDWMYQDDIRMLPLNPIPYGEPNSQEAYDHINARISIDNMTALGGSLSVALWVKNLTNESWRTTGVNFVTYAINSWGPPRTWGVDFNYQF